MPAPYNSRFLRFLELHQVTIEEYEQYSEGYPFFWFSLWISRELHKAKDHPGSGVAKRQFGISGDPVVTDHALWDKWLQRPGMEPISDALLDIAKWRATRQ